MDLIKAITEPLGVNAVDFVAKIENDPLLKVLYDNRHIFEKDIILDKLIQWVQWQFFPVFSDDPELITRIRTNPQKYLHQMVILIVPTIHMKFYHAHHTNTATSTQVIEVLLSLLGINSIPLIRNNEMELVW